ncbi:hypothetical protein ACFL0V_04440 [Nanoarchaeota archaeon]
MAILESFKITREDILKSGQLGPSSYLRERDVNELIKRLNEQGAEIDPSISEQDIEYMVIDDKRQSTVPLRTSFEDDVRVTGYTLRSRQLELILTDYQHRRKSGPSGRIGGPVICETGVQCSLRLEGTSEEAEVVRGVKRTLREFYQ